MKLQNEEPVSLSIVNPFQPAQGAKASHWVRAHQTLTGPDTSTGSWRAGLDSDIVDGPNPDFPKFHPG